MEIGCRENRLLSRSVVIGGLRYSPAWVGTGFVILSVPLSSFLISSLHWELTEKDNAKETSLGRGTENRVELLRKSKKKFL